MFLHCFFRDWWYTFILYLKNDVVPLVNLNKKPLMLVKDFVCCKNLMEILYYYIIIF